MQDVDVLTYFHENAPRIPQITALTANAIVRSGVDTMGELCGKSDDELKRTRYLGEKCLKLAIAMRDKYAGEINISEEKKK